MAEQADHAPRLSEYRLEDMPEIDTLGILRDIQDGAVDEHADLFEASQRHREEHGCSVYPSSLVDAPMWKFLAATLKAKRFLELGCGLGYTSALMATAGGDGSHVDAIESEADHADLARQAFEDKGLGDRIHILVGQARDLLPDLEKPYDVIFVDLGWKEYPQFLPHLTRLTRVGGVLVTSNLFTLFEEWAQELPDGDQVAAYLKGLTSDPRFRTYIIPDRFALSYRVS